MRDSPARPRLGWLSQPDRIAHSSRSRGHKLPGWEEVNVSELARLMSVNPTHLRSLLTGRKTGRITTYQSLCRELGLTWATLWERIRLAQEADIVRMKYRAAKVSGRIRESQRMARRFKEIERIRNGNQRTGNE